MGISWIVFLLLIVQSIFAKKYSLGNGLRYEVNTTLLLKETGHVIPSSDVGFQLTSFLDVTPLWIDPKDPNTLLIKITLVSPKLWIKSRKAPKPEGFMEHRSRLDIASNRPILIVLRNDRILTIYVDPLEDVSIINIKRGLASLFQYRTVDGDIAEIDASGTCNVTYACSGPYTVNKIKTLCSSQKVPQKIEHPNYLLRTEVTSTRNIVYELLHNFLPNIIEEEEIHTVSLSTKPDAGTTIFSRRTLRLIPNELQHSVIKAGTYQDVVNILGLGLEEASIELEKEPMFYPDLKYSTIDEVLQEYKDALTSPALGNSKSASAFLKILPLVKQASAESLSKILNNSRYRDIKPQLYNLLGSASTNTTHHAAMKALSQDYASDDHERYLWALSMSPVASADIVQDILSSSEDRRHAYKISETIILTAAAMANRCGNSSMTKHTLLSLNHRLESCTNDECKLKFIRAIKNLSDKASIPILLPYVLYKNTKAVCEAAWRALGSFHNGEVTPEIKTAAVNTFFQLGGPRRDSTIRTHALNIILENDPNIQQLRDLLIYLTSNESNFEIKKYAQQRLFHLAHVDSIFNTKLKDAWRLEAKNLNNYNVLAQRGLSTAFSRVFLQSTGLNGSLFTIQEVNSGLLKRGVVDIILRKGNYESTFFSLGVFASGLESFTSAAEQDESIEINKEQPTAGMEISLMGVGIRPFTFFAGQGELMSHVWSGTASERTPAFQILTNLHQHKEYIPLASGFVAEINIDGALSFDLSGQIQMSLWSRNAQSAIEMSAGIAVHGNIGIRSSFVQCAGDFTLTMDPKFKLATDVDFSGPVALCIKLTQLETTIKHYIYKIERIPSNRHKLRKTRRIRLYSAPRSFFLNQKNNEMCSKLID